jgi:CRISPR-associated endonuclease/helicase Cas3
MPHQKMSCGDIFTKTLEEPISHALIRRTNRTYFLQVLSSKNTKDTPMTAPEYWAHTPSKQNPRWHRFIDHELEVTRLAEQFASCFGGHALARYLGLLHDLGKLTPEFQQYLRDCNAGIKRKPGSAPHKQHGAQAVLDDLTESVGEEFAGVLAAVVHGHHGGIKDRPSARNDIQAKGITSESVKALRELAASINPDFAAPVPSDDLFPSGLKTEFDFEMYLRFVFSVLTDADVLDTEAHTDPESAKRRLAKMPSLTELRDCLIHKQKADFDGCGDTPVNQVRREVYETCLAMASLPRGFFTMTVPTGGAKTRSSLVGSLVHAVFHKMGRVIYAIPYTSIVDQTAGVFRAIFKEYPHAVLEHHSAIDPRRSSHGAGDDGGEEELWRRLAAQNWDAPLIVTTTVQLFESLFSNRPAACRKLHRLANSVIVLDEVQTLPANLLEPIRSALKTLVEHFGVTVIFCTATQPALETQSEFLTGLNATPIIPADVARTHFEQLRRVKYRVEEVPWTWEQVAEEMRRDGQSSLCVLNTRRQALELLDGLDPKGDDRHVLHLSTLMCGKHRRRVLRKIRLCLRWNIPIWVVSTQVIEAGVDVDFPKVLRAVGPLDRIIQAAGRCNREGLRPRDQSHVIIFTPIEDASPRGIYRMALESTVNLFLAARARGEAVDFDDPTFVTDYFARLFEDIGPNADGKEVQPYRKDFNYPEVASRMRLIDEETVSVMVLDYDTDEANAILDKARAIGHMTRDLWRHAQPLCVSIRARDAKTIQETEFGLLLWQGRYDAKKGIDLPNDPADAVVYDPRKLFY